MGRTYESSYVGATANRSFKKINRPSTEVADLILDNEFNIELVLRQGASPVVSLDLLDDFEKTAAFSKNLLKEGYSTPNSLFVTRSELDGIFLLGGDLAALNARLGVRFGGFGRLRVGGRSGGRGARHRVQTGKESRPISRARLIGCAVSQLASLKSRQYGSRSAATIFFNQVTLLAISLRSIAITAY